MKPGCGDLTPHSPHYFDGPVIGNRQRTFGCPGVERGELFARAAEVRAHDERGQWVCTWHRHADGRWFRWKSINIRRLDETRRRQFWTVDDITARARLLGWTLHPSGGTLVGAEQTQDFEVSP